jgi:uncharacterized repeat protein (TIGR01451 family)
MLLFGAHLARDYEWGTDKGAHEWPTGTANIGWLNYSGGSGQSTAGHTNVKVSDNILNNPSQSDLSVVAADSPDPVNAGQNLTFSILVSNSGPLSSTADTLTDAIPAGTTFVSATAPAGWTLTTPAVGGTGIVQWVLPTILGPSASATFGLVVAVDTSAVGTVENTATLTPGNVDAYLTNNSSHTSTIILGACAAPVVSSDPAAVGVCVGDTASFSAAASGIPAPAIQWQMMPNGGGSFSDLIGETAGSLRFSAAMSQNGNQYRARFSNACGTAFSAAATLNWCPGNNAPVVSIISPAAGAAFVVGDSMALVGSFTDDAGNTHTAVWTIGDVEIPGVVDDSTGSVVASFTFPAPGTYTLKLTVTDQYGAIGMSSQVAGEEAMVVAYDPSVLGVEPGMNFQFMLAQNAPNPFRIGTQIRFSLPVQARVKLSVYDIVGRRVASLSDQVWEAGSHGLDWSGRTDGGALAPGGVYVIQMVAQTTAGDGHYRAQKTMVRIN